MANDTKATYLHKTKDFSGNIVQTKFKCNILEYTGTKSVKIQVFGVVGSRPNPVITVRRWNVVDEKQMFVN